MLTDDELIWSYLKENDSKNENNYKVKNERIILLLVLIKPVPDISLLIQSVLKS